MRIFLGAVLLPSGLMAQTSNWGQPAAPEPEGFDWTAPISPGFWMAWTHASAAFFVFIFCAILLMGIREYFRPGGHPRYGVLGIETTRGDRLFITLLGAAFLFLGWLGIVGTPLWGFLALAVIWGGFVFWKV
ncbi:MAG: DUF2160 domain-containing protein [Pseudomonadota bacterium]